MENGFRSDAVRVLDWIMAYRAGLRDRPVRAQVQPGDIAALLESAPPPATCTLDDALNAIERIILPGLTHWQHPRFFAYFPANGNAASFLGEMLMAGFGVNAMLWETSPAATELETRVLDWLRQSLAMAPGWHGVIQDTASSATFIATLVAREKALDWRGNEDGLAGAPKLTVYASVHAHSSVEKAVMMAGLGRSALRRIPARADGGMDVDALNARIAADLETGHRPALLVGTLGSTDIGAFDPLGDLAATARQHGLYFHVDAAWAGTAMLCPEYRSWMNGVDGADSFVFNPHKWMGVHFDCTAHYVRDPDSLTRTLSILPDYLKTAHTGHVRDHRDWGLPLGRRFRALKLWLVLRLTGLDAIRAMIRNHVTWAQALADWIDAAPGFTRLAGPNLSLVTFRFGPEGAQGDRLTEALLEAVNADGFCYLTRGQVAGRKAIRFQIGAEATTLEDVRASWERINSLAVGA
ncbi:pyridoxal phosphate-dependent decarboxylase family protein [Yunchengibacter salinarum]|uniref:pyridoxal phosphate-dependent decarboxylase family protein n=1 Tax=Yunchengibacter salinarum TaxID=3133399 RepID=UPI0035B646E8